VISLFRRKNSFKEESLMDEPWEDGMMTIKEEKAVYEMLSVHLCGGHFKRKWTTLQSHVSFDRKVSIFRNAGYNDL